MCVECENYIFDIFFVISMKCRLTPKMPDVLFQMWPVQEHSLGGKFTFNDPKHTAKTMQEWLRHDSGNVLE